MLTVYSMEGQGDLPRKGFCPPVFSGLKVALIWLENWCCSSEEGLNPEDDRVVVWKEDAGSPRKVVWHFSGWHWDEDEFDLPQGCFLGHEKSVYEEVMEDGWRLSGSLIVNVDKGANHE